MGRLLVCLVAVLMLALPAGASAATARQGATYTCTETIHKGSVGYGIVFAGSNKSLLRAGCRLFAQGSAFRIRWGIHRPTGWVLTAEYVHPKLMMEALLIAPAALKDLVFALTNKTVFTNHGWVFVKRG